MKTNFLSAAMALSDGDLLTRIAALAETEREAAAELVAHLAVLELRPSLYLSLGYGSLFDYCIKALHMSEDTACNRIQVTRVCQRFPVVLDRLAQGALTLSALRMLGPHLTAENLDAVLARAAHRRRGDIEALAAELAPKAAVVASVRKVPVRHATTARSTPPPSVSAAAPAGTGTPTVLAFAPQTESLRTATDDRDAVAGPVTPPAPVRWSVALPPHPPRPTIRASAPNRYRVQFTIGQESHDKLRRLQALLRREIPSGDPGLIFERMLVAYLEKVEKAKTGGPTTAKRRPDGSYGNRIRRAADTHSRHIPTAVKRAVWFRDAGQCAFVSAEGRRCAERAFLELHHIHPYALGGHPPLETSRFGVDATTRTRPKRSSGLAEPNRGRRRFPSTIDRMEGTRQGRAERARASKRASPDPR